MYKLSACCHFHILIPAISHFFLLHIFLRSVRLLIFLLTPHCYKHTHSCMHAVTCTLSNSHVKNHTYSHTHLYWSNVHTLPHTHTHTHTHIVSRLFFHIPGSETGSAIASHPDIRKLGFTGSTGVGQVIMMSCAVSNIKKVSLELGGKSPLIIFDDCDLDRAVRMVSLFLC
jgi:hypothetical protein